MQLAGGPLLVSCQQLYIQYIFIQISSHLIIYRAYLTTAVVKGYIPADEGFPCNKASVFRLAMKGTFFISHKLFYPQDLMVVWEIFERIGG
jgi:hypothetical protein